MKRTITVTAVILALLLAIAWQGEKIEGWINLQVSLRRIRGLDVSSSVGVGSSTHLVSTSVAGPSGESLRSYYQSLASSMASKSQDCFTICWSDDGLLYPRWSTVLPLASGYVEVCAAENNDNDSLTITFSETPFSYSKRVGVQRRSSADLPKGFMLHPERTQK